MNENIKYTLSEHWKIPDEQLEQAYELTKKYGIDLIAEHFDSYDTQHTKEYFEELDQRIAKEILFEAKNWEEMFSILNDIFEFGELESFGLFDTDDLLSRIEKKRLMYFYEFKEDKSNKKVICCKGSNVSLIKEEWIAKGYKKWKTYQMNQNQIFMS